MKTGVMIIAGAVAAAACANVDNESYSAEEEQVASASAGADYDVAGSSTDAAAGADASVNAGVAPSMTPATPEEFAREALQLSRLTVEASALAAQNSSNPEVKAFAAKVQTDHEAIVSRLEVAYPDAVAGALDAQRTQIIADLGVAADFDNEYLDLIEDSHERAIAMYSGYADGAPGQMASETSSADGEQMAEGDADTEEATLIAQETLPMLETHLAEIRRVDALVDAADDAGDMLDADEN